MKSYTDLEQSKKLSEILPLESADMKILPFNEREYRIVPIYDIAVCGRGDEIYAWSLAALLDVIPSGKALIHDKGNLGYKCICNNMDTYFHDNPVDACYKMIIKLNELKML